MDVWLGGRLLYPCPRTCPLTDSVSDLRHNVGDTLSKQAPSPESLPRPVCHGQGIVGWHVIIHGCKGIVPGTGRMHDMSPCTGGPLWWPWASFFSFWSGSLLQNSSGAAAPSRMVRCGLAPPQGQKWRGIRLWAKALFFDEGRCQ